MYNEFKYVGNAKDLWYEECDNSKGSTYVKDFIGEKYIIETINGTIKVDYPYWIGENRPYDRKQENANENRDNNFLTIALNHDNIIEIPKENIIYIYKNTSEYLTFEKDYFREIGSKE